MEWCEPLLWLLLLSDWLHHPSSGLGTHLQPTILNVLTPRTSEFWNRQLCEIRHNCECQTQVRASAPTAVLPMTVRIFMSVSRLYQAYMLNPATIICPELLTGL